MIYFINTNILPSLIVFILKVYILLLNFIKKKIIYFYPLLLQVHFNYLHQITNQLIVYQRSHQKVHLNLLFYVHNQSMYFSIIYLKLVTASIQNFLIDQIHLLNKQTLHPSNSLLSSLKIILHQLSSLNLKTLLYLY